VSALEFCSGAAARAYPTPFRVMRGEPAVEMDKPLVVVHEPDTEIARVVCCTTENARLQGFAHE
jgi:hypothetical protein